MTCSEVSKKTGISLHMIQNAAREGVLPATRVTSGQGVGRQGFKYSIDIPLDDVRSILKAQYPQSRIWRETEKQTVTGFHDLVPSEYGIRLNVAAYQLRVRYERLRSFLRNNRKYRVTVGDRTYISPEGFEKAKLHFANQTNGQGRLSTTTKEPDLSQRLSKIEELLTRLCEVWGVK